MVTGSKVGAVEVINLGHNLKIEPKMLLNNSLYVSGVDFGVLV